MNDTMTINDSLYDVIIIGSGPAGLTAGIYAARANLKTLIIAGDIWGGQLMLTTEVENYPGFEEGVQGPELMEKMRKQAVRFGSEWVGKSVSRVNFNKYPFEVGTDKSLSSHSGEVIESHLLSLGSHLMKEEKQSMTTNDLMPINDKFFARSVIVAVGAETKWLNVPGEVKFIGRGVSSCAPCDAAFFRNKRVFVVGGGDAAMEEALVLTKFASEVTLVHRRGEFRASKIMVDRVMAHEKIKVWWDTEVEEMMGENKLEGVVLKTARARWQNDGNEMMERGQGELIEQSSDVVRWKVSIDGTFVAIGHSPMTKIFGDQLELDEKGYVIKISNIKYQISNIRNEDFNFKWLKEGDKSNWEEMVKRYPTLTSREGVFVAGDVHDYHYKQAVTAAAFGCMAAMDMEKWLEEKGEIQGVRTQSW